MTMLIRHLLFVALFATAGAQATDDYNEIFEQAVNAVEFDFDKRWAYTETQVGSEHVWVGRFDPRRPPLERWQLITVDGHVPSDDEIEEYLEDRVRDLSDTGENDVNALVEPDSVRLIEDSDDYWLLSFVPDDENIVMDSVDATIRIDKADGHLEYIDLRNHSTIKPAFGIRISKLITRLTFGAAVADGPIVPLSTQVEAKGRAFLFVSFDEQELLHNSDFEYVGEE